MPGWSNTNRRGSRRARSLDIRLLVGLLLLMALLVFHAYRQWMTPPEQALIGRAHVVDGDSIEISGSRIRLEGIDAPELDQTCTDPRGQAWSCGRTAVQELRSHVRGQELRCEPLARDRYERTLAVCTLPDGSDVNAWIVRQGWALASGRSGKYQSEQDEAEAARRGIWAGKFTPPWEWRQQHPE
jgi:endonuclease YncB( thermonuclease family)